MKIFTALLTLVLTATLSITAAAQEVAGSWRAESISDVEPPEGVSLTLAFGDEGKATLTYTMAGESQSWQYSYAVKDGQLTLEPANAFGEPQTVTYDIKLDEGKLLFLTPKPDPVVDETEEADADADSEGEAGADAEDATKGDAEEEEDTRTPVWVLTKA